MKLVWGWLFWQLLRTAGFSYCLSCGLIYRKYAPAGMMSVNHYAICPARVQTEFKLHESSNLQQSHNGSRYVKTPSPYDLSAVRRETK